MTEENETITNGEVDALLTQLGGALIAKMGLLDDRSVGPFKEHCCDSKAMVDAFDLWFPNGQHLKRSVRFSLYSAFFAGMLHQKGVRPGSDPTTVSMTPGE